MAENDFLVWAAGVDADVLTQAEFAPDPNLLNGVTTGRASSSEVNKLWRQASIMASMIAQFIVDRTSDDVVDDGTIATIEASFIAAIQTLFSIPATGVVPGVYGPASSFTVEADGRLTQAVNQVGRIGNGVQVYFAHGTYTFTVSPGVYELDVELWGAGAGGWGSVGESFGTEGAGSGGYCRKLIATTPGAQFSIVVGLAGSGGAAGGDTGGNGADSTFSVFGGALIMTAGGGKTATEVTFVGFGGTATGGDVNMLGGSGESGGLSGTLGSWETFAGNGGSAPNGGAGGKGGQGTISEAGKVPGGGGAGASGVTTVAGTSGADGGCIVRY